MLIDRLDDLLDLAKCRSHFVCQSAGDDHDVRLAGRRAENNTHAVLVVARSRQMHHLDGAAGETERHGPERSLARPVCDLVHGGAVSM